MIIFFPILTSESDRPVIGTVTSLQVQEPHGETVRVTWVGVQGATAYRVSWKRMDGNLSLDHVKEEPCLSVT